MKFALITLGLLVLLIGTESAPREFNFNGLKGVIDTSSSINGVETIKADPKMISKAEEIIKTMILKKLDKKKEAKKAEKQVKKVPENAESIDKLSNINWDDHPEARDRINDRIPGGVESIDALVRFIQERRGQN